MVVCALIAQPHAALAEELAFGGRGEDALFEAISCEDGFFAVGRTASTDGDLASRKRTGDTGWALRVDGSGQRMWDFCSAKSGMYDMAAPHAYADGRFSLVLTDETRQRGEWIMLDSRGRQESRVAFDAKKGLCAHGEQAHILQMVPACGGTGPYLALLLEHADIGEICCTALFPDGGVRTCGAFYGDTKGVAIAAGADGVLYAGADLGALSVTHLRPGMPPDTRIVLLEEENAGLSGVEAALLGEDESLLISGQISSMQRSEAVLLRVSAEGEVLFLAEPGGEAPLSRLCETNTGYAALCGSRVYFLDEDGAPLGQAAAPENTRALLPDEGGVLALNHHPERTRRQAVFTPLAIEAAVLETPVQHEERTPEPTPVPEAGAAISLADGYLRCTDGGVRGVTVARMDAQGHILWQTRTPIHTAADRLVWETAQIAENGDILLSGYYETQTAQGALRESAGAVLSADGVLREIGLSP